MRSDLNQYIYVLCYAGLRMQRSGSWLNPSVWLHSGEMQTFLSTFGCVSSCRTAWPLFGFAFAFALTKAKGTVAGQC